MTEIIFEVTEDNVDGGYSANALGHGIHTQGDSVDEIHSNVRETVDCYFADTMLRPKLIRLHFMGGTSIMIKNIKVVDRHHELTVEVTVPRWMRGAQA